jgi:hypothetical protein
MVWLGELLGFAWEYTRRDPYDSSKGNPPTWTETWRFLCRLPSDVRSIVTSLVRHLRDRRA